METEFQQQAETQAETPPETETPRPKPVDLTRATGKSADIQFAVMNLFGYHPWSPEQMARGREVRITLEQAYQQIIASVPVCPDRTVALRKLREVALDCNTAITHFGR